MSLNLRKKATTFLTPRGQQRMTDSLHTSMDTLLRMFEGQPSYDLASLVENMDGGPEQALELIHEAHMNGLLTTTEGEAPVEEIDLTFPSMASKLNMKKTASSVEDFGRFLYSTLEANLALGQEQYNEHGDEDVFDGLMFKVLSWAVDTNQIELVQTGATAQLMHQAVDWAVNSFVQNHSNYEPWMLGVDETHRAVDEIYPDELTEGPHSLTFKSTSLNMKKTSYEIGGIEFPDETYKGSEADQSLMYKEAESFVINYIWSGLSEQGVTGPDGANVIQEDADKIRFSEASTLVNQFLDEGFSMYINQSNNPVLQESAELRQSLYNAIKNAIFFEGEI